MSKEKPEANVRSITDLVVLAYPKEVAEYRVGTTKLLGFFVGQVMQATNCTANPVLVNEHLKELLSDE